MDKMSNLRITDPLVTCKLSILESYYIFDVTEVMIISQLQFIQNHSELFGSFF